MGSLLFGNGSVNGTTVITIAETRDFVLIKSICADPEIYAAASADGAPPAENFAPCELEGIRYVAVRRDAETVGIWMLVPHSTVCWEIHTALLKTIRGKDAVLAAELMKQWVWSSTTCLRLITNVPAFNRRTIVFCHMVGMEPFGNNGKSFMKDGKLHDQLMFGLSKPGVL